MFNNRFGHRSSASWMAVLKAAATSILMLTIALAANAAQDYPSKPVRLIVPVPPGGPSDALARILSQRLAEVWKQPLVVENRPGASNAIGTELAARAAPDGYTVLLLVDSTVTMLPFRKQGTPYSAQSLTPVMTLIDSPIVIAASSATKVQTMSELVDLAKARPGELGVAFGSFSTQVFLTQLSTLANMRLLPVPYKGAGETTQALIAGDVRLAATAYASIRPHVGTGKISILAITGKTRHPAMPSVPTLAEIGYPGFDYGVWVGLAVPTGTPSQIIEKLHADVGRIMETADVQERVRAMGSLPIPGDPASAAELVRVESAKWKKVIPTISVEID